MGYKPYSVASNNKMALRGIVLAGMLALTACGEMEIKQVAGIGQYTYQANAYFEQSQFKAALNAAKTVIDNYPDSADGYLLFAKIYNRLGQPEQAIQALSSYQADKNAEYYHLLLAAYQQSNKLVAANKLLLDQQALLAQQPERLNLSRAKILLLEKDFEQANRLFEALESQPKYAVEAFIGQARINIAAGKTDQALIVLNQANTLDAGNSEARILKSYLLINNSELEQAEDELTTALTMLKSADIFTPERINILQALTQVLTLRGHSAEALFYSRILADEFPEATLIKQHYAQAVTYFEKQSFDQAKIELEKLLVIAPANKKALTLLGVILYSQGDVRGAHKYLDGLVNPDSDAVELTQLYLATQIKLNNPANVLALLSSRIETESNLKTLTLYYIAALQDMQFEKGKYALDKILQSDPDSIQSILLEASYYSKKVPAQHEHALSLLKEGVTQFPEELKLQQAYLRKLLVLQKHEEADLHVAQLQKIAANNVDSLLLIANYQLARQQVTKAQKLFEQVLLLSENNQQALYGLAYSYQFTEQWPEALNAYKKIISLYPQELKAYQGSVLSLMKQTNNIEQLQKILPENHDRAILALVLVDLQLQQYKLQTAQENLQIAMQGIDHNLMAYAQNLKQKIDFLQADQALASSEFGVARKLVLKNLQISANSAPFLMLLARIETKSEQYNEAKKVLLQLESILPNNPLVTIAQADLALVQNQQTEALNLLKNRWQQANNEKIAQKLYQLLGSTNDLQAEQFLEKWLKTMPDSSSANLNKALNLQARGKNKEALDLYEKILTQVPNQLTSLNNAAWLYFNENNARAEILAAQAYAISPKNADIIDTYGWIIYKAGKVEEAKKLLEKAHQLAPNKVEIALHLQEVQSKS